MKSRPVVVRFNSILYEKIKRKADSMGMNISEYIRYILMKDLEL